MVTLWTLCPFSKAMGEDVNSTRFLFRNLAIAASVPETQDLHTGVMDTEHIMRTQCLFYSSVLFQYLRNKPYDPNKQAIAVVGGGRLGRMIVQSMIALGWAPDTILVCTRDIAKVKDLRVSVISSQMVARVALLSCMHPALTGHGGQSHGKPCQPG